MLSKPLRRVLAAGALAGALSLLGAVPAAALPRGGHDERTPAVERARGTLSRLWIQVAKRLSNFWDTTSGNIVPGR